MNRQQKSIDAEKKLIENINLKGWSLSPKFQYINSTKKVYVLCNKGHELYILPSGINNAKSGKGCMKCRRENDMFTNLNGVKYRQPNVDISPEITALGDLVRSNAGRVLNKHSSLQ